MSWNIYDDVVSTTGFVLLAVCVVILLFIYTYVGRQMILNKIDTRENRRLLNIRCNEIRKNLGAQPLPDKVTDSINPLSSFIDWQREDWPETRI